jgi:hypothetical protein
MTGSYPPPHPQQPPPDPAGGQPAIAVTTKFLWLSWFFFFIKPKIFLNGHEVAAVWGRNVIPVPPGQHHLHLFVPYFLPPKVGPADLTVPVQPGQPPVELEYRAPVWAFSKGSLGPPPQKYNGAGLMIGIMVGVLVVLCLCCGLNIAASASA